MATTAIDPVCGMSVDIATARHKSEYQGETYYFCAPGCKRSFEANPEQYLKQGDQGGGHSGHGAHH
jgi:YHS domain-containing protein